MIEEPNEKTKMVRDIKTKVRELNELFDKAAHHYLKFDGGLVQDRSFGEGDVAYFHLKIYEELGIKKKKE